jgi:hypothetical protein
VESYCCAWSHSKTHTHSVGLLWKRDRPVAVTSTWQHTTLTRNRHPWPNGIRSRNLSKRAAADPSLDRAATGIEVRTIIIKSTITLCYVCCGDLLQTAMKWTCLKERQSVINMGSHSCYSREVCSMEMLTGYRLGHKLFYGRYKAASKISARQLAHMGTKYVLTVSRGRGGSLHFVIVYFGPK